MNASLPMYMRPELAEDHNLYWSLIKKHLNQYSINVSGDLQHPTDFNAFWLDKNLLLSQTCGMPYRNSLHGKVQLVGTPDFNVSGCKPGYYCSAMVVRPEDKDKPLAEFKKRVLAYNSKDSQSGYSAPYWHCHNAGFWFDKTHCSGGHQLSALAVLDGTADIAAIDAVTWRMLCTYEPFTSNLHVLDWTKPTPGLPYITSLDHDPEQIHKAVSLAIDELPTPAKERLGIRSLIHFEAQDYLAIKNPDTN